MAEALLSGRTIAVPESRELDVFAELLSRRGAQVLRCPLVSILDAPDPAPVLDWVNRFNAGAFDDLILLTGEGLRRLLSCIDHNTPSSRGPFVAQLARVRKITRGPKPARALRELALKPDLAAGEPTTAGIIAALGTLDLRGRRVAVQLYGTDPNPPLMQFLESAGAEVTTVAPYRYAGASTAPEVLALVTRMAAGDVDAIAFTSKAQVERLYEVARTAGREAELARALEKTLVAAVGPVVRDELAAHGVKVTLMPDSAYFLKPLTSLLASTLGPRTG